MDLRPSALPQFVLDALEHTGDGLVALDREWRYVYVNQTAGRLFGRAPGALLGRHYLDAFPEARGTPFTRAYERAMASGEPEVLEQYFAPWDRWFENRVYPSPDGLTVLFTEVTDRRRAEAAREAASASARSALAARVEAATLEGARLRVVLDTLTQGVLAVNADGSVAEYNAAFARLHGFAEVADARAAFAAYAEHFRKVRVEAPDVDVPPAEWPASRALSGRGDDPVEYAVSRRDTGAVLFIGRYAAAVVRDAAGRAVQAIVTVEDVTARRAAEAAREAERRRFRALVEHGTDLIAILEPDGTNRYASPAHAAVLGTGAAAIVGRNCFAFAHPDDRAALSAAFDRAVADGAADAGVIRFRRAGGGWCSLAVRLTDLRDEPAVRGLVANSRDVTEERRLQDRLRQAQKLEALGQLAGGVAHDFNNVLSAVLGFSELALAGVAEHGPTYDASADLREIRDAARRATALTRRLLTFGRQQALRPEPVDLRALVLDLEGILQRLLGAGVSMTVTPDPRPAVVHADRSQLEQVILNLVVNARDAMPTGGVIHLEVGPADAATLRAAAEAGAALPAAVHLVVADEGVGMDAATRARAFDPFFTTKPPGLGTGLGLATVYGVVCQSGGAVWFDSAPGAGTRVHVVLPPAGAAAAPAPPATAEPPPAARPLSVLVVDDEAPLRALLRRVLVRHGHQVHEAKDAADALRLARDAARPLDLLITDVVMPAVSGVTLAERVHAERPDVAVLLVSGYPDAAGVGALGAPLLAKPFTTRELLEAVARAASARAAAAPG